MSGYINESMNRDAEFKATDYPEAMRELAKFRDGAKHLVADRKTEMIISYIKDHCLQTAWALSNSEIARLITSRAFAISHIESLFQFSLGNKSFLKDLEDHITNEIFAVRYKRRQVDEKNNQGHSCIRAVSIL